MKNDQVDSNDVYVKLMFQCYAFNTVVCIAYFLAQMAILGGPASFPSYVPVWTPFYIVYIYETFLVMTGFILPVVFSDLFFMTIIMLLGKQFKLLNEQVEKIFDCDNHTPESGRSVGRNLKKCVRHHNFLLRCIEDLNAILSKTLLIYIFVMVSGICTHMYTLSFVDDIGQIIEPALRITLGLFELNLCFSFPAQSMVNQAEQIGVSLYLSKWHKYPSHSKAVLLGLLSGRIEAFIDIGGFGRLNMQTCLLTMKTMMSYFMFLRTVGSIS